MIYFEILIHEISHKLQIVLDLRFKSNTVSCDLDLRWCVFIFCAWKNIYSLLHALCLMGLQNMCDNGSSTHESRTKLFLEEAFFVQNVNDNNM